MIVRFGSVKIPVSVLKPCSNLPWIAIEAGPPGCGWYGEGGKPVGRYVKTPLLAQLSIVIEFVVWQQLRVENRNEVAEYPIRKDAA